LSASDRKVRFWDVATGRLVRTLQVEGIHAWGMALSSDGRRLAVSGLEHGITVFDVQSGQEVLPGTGHRGTVLGAHYSADGRHVATCGSDDSMRLWDAATGRESKVLQLADGTWLRGCS